MRAFFEKFRRVDTLKNMDLKSVLNRSPIGSGSSVDSILASSFRTLHFPYQNNSSKIGFLARIHDGAPLTRILHVLNPLRRFSAMPKVDESFLQGTPAAMCDVPQRIKFKRLDKTAKNIMNILDKEAVEEVKTIREVPDIRPGYIIQLKVEVPENKRRVSIVKGIVIARRNAGLNTTFRLRRLVAGVGVESLFPLYSPNLKEIKVLEKKKVRRAKLYYLRDKMNALKKR